MALGLEEPVRPEWPAWPTVGRREGEYSRRANPGKKIQCQEQTRDFRGPMGIHLGWNVSNNRIRDIPR